MHKTAAKLQSVLPMRQNDVILPFYAKLLTFNNSVMQKKGNREEKMPAENATVCSCLSTPHMV